MKPAQEKLAVDLQKINFEDLRFPVIENVSAEANTKGERAREALTMQVSAPVRWADSIESLIAQGVETFVEVGTGKILAGLVRQINRDVRCLSVENADSLKNTLETL